QLVFGAPTQPQCEFSDHLFDTALIAARSNTEIGFWGGGEALPALTTTHPGLTSGIGPFRWNGAMANSTDSLFAYGHWYLSQLRDVRPFTSLPYDLRQGGSVVQSGSIPWNDTTPILQIPVTPGKYELDVQDTQWYLGDQP